MKSTLYRVYVIEVFPIGSPARKGPRHSCTLYVGSTAEPIAKRFREHVAGKRFCKSCTKRHYVPVGHRVRLRPDLYKRHNPMHSRLEAERMEKHLARVLRWEGYRVLGGH